MTATDDYAAFNGFKHSLDLEQRIARRQQQEGLNRSETLRRLTEYATRHMPAGWHPGRDRKDTPA